MKMLVSMLFMGMVSTGTAARGVALSKKERDFTARGIRGWPDSPPRTTIEDRMSFDPDLPLQPDQEVPEAVLNHFTRAQHLVGRAGYNLGFLRLRLERAIARNGPAGLKRALDIIASALLLLALSPLFALLAILIKIEDGGPVFFAQTRVGRYGREFKMYKIRSMCMDAEKKLQDLLGANEHKEGVTFKLKEDPRITRTGRWLRKFSLDELPQLYNVLLGNMSLVGPRPPVPREVARYSLADRRRLLVTPGITCIWQISGRSEIDFSGQVRLDVQYIEHQNLWTDFRILARTLPAVISGRGAC